MGVCRGTAGRGGVVRRWKLEREEESPSEGKGARD